MSSYQERFREQTLEEYLFDTHTHDVDTTLSLSSIPYGSIPGPVLSTVSTTESHSLAVEDINNYVDEPMFIYELGSGSGIELGRDEERDYGLWTWDLGSDPVPDVYINGEREVIDLTFGEWIGEELSDMETEEFSIASSSSIVDPLDATDYSLSNLLLVFAEEDAFMFDAFYSATVDQSVRSEGRLKGTPPAAKRVVENLPLVELSKEELKEGVVACAVCKEEAVEGEMVNKLPCSHYYHKDCILPWLKIRNTCPACRYALPTDNQEYESRKRTRVASEVSN